MPSHLVHRWCGKMVLGESFPFVDKQKDEPYQWLGGQRHRVLFHEVVDDIWMFGGQAIEQINDQVPEGEMTEGMKVLMYAMLHTNIDKLCSKNPRLRIAFELLANMDEGKALDWLKVPI